MRLFLASSIVVPLLFCLETSARALPNTSIEVQENGLAGRGVLEHTSRRRQHPDAESTQHDARSVPSGGKVSQAPPKNTLGRVKGRPSGNGTPEAPQTPDGPDGVPKSPESPVNTAAKPETRPATAKKAALKVLRRAFGRQRSKLTGVDDNSTPEEADEVAAICTRDPGGCKTRQLKAWEVRDAATGEITQKPFRILSKADQEGLLAEAEEGGRQLKSDMKKWVGAKRSRLEAEGSKQDENYDLGYVALDTLDDAGNYRPDELFGGITRSYHEAGMKVDGNKGYTMSATYSVEPGQLIRGEPSPATVLFVSPEQGSLVTKSMHTKYDGTAKNERAYSSTQTWHALKAIAGKLVRFLKTHLQHEVKNEESRNIMGLLHERNRHKVDQIPMGTDNKPLGPAAGHAKWTYKEAGYNKALHMPNVRVSARMVQDRNPEMDNPFIVEVHTYPEINAKDFPTAKKEDLREGYTLVVFGPMPKDA